ncbi:hypothetical protein FWG95_01000 [Candidatus Saccharibacteria bacterium]|nr:hypothetical protein [Candidatus Saccharibacteria bacterium]
MADLDFAALDAAADDIVASEEVNQSAPAPDVKPEKEAPSARRFRGQFMDMVHPSSDVKVAAKPNLAQHSNNPFGLSKSEEPAAQPAPEKPVEPTEPDNLEPSTPESINEEPDKPADNAYESPFLPDAKVEKRPLGNPDFDSNVGLLSDEPDQELLSSGEKDDELLTAGEEPEAFLSAGGENSNPEAAPTDSQPDDQVNPKPTPIDSDNAEVETTEKQEDQKVDHLPRQNAEDAPVGDVRTSIANTMIMPQYKATNTAAPAEAQSPFAAAAEPMKRTKTKHFPIWAWILVFILLAVAGAALGAWLYTSGWLE